MTDHAAAQLWRGSLWMVAMRWTLRALGLVSTLILARLLAPDDFGLIAMAAIVIGLLEIVAYAGVDLALLRDQEDHKTDRSLYDTAWTLQLLQGLIVGIVVITAAPAMALIFSDVRVIPVLQAMALRAIFDGAQNIGTVAFRRELDFAREFRYQLVTKGVSFVIVIVAALWLRNYWALVIGALAGSAAALVLSYVFHDFRPRWSFARMDRLLAFSQWLLLARLGGFAARKADVFVVGVAAGPNAMGIYNVASEIATMPASELVMPVRRALFPTLSQLVDNPGEFSRAVLTSLSALVIACSALGFGLAACASEAVAVILGSRWGDAAPLMRWLAVFGIATAITGLIEVLLWLAGRTKLAAMLSWAELILLLPAVWWGFQTAGTEGIAVARCAIAWLMVPVLLWSVTAAGPVKSFQLAIVVLRPVVAGLVMFALLTAIPWSTHWHLALTILAKVAVGAGVFTTTLYIFWRMAGCPNTAESYVFNGTWWRSLVKNQN